MQTVHAVALSGLAFILQGCATSAAGLARTDVEMTLYSPDKSPKQVAECTVDSMIGDPQLRGEGDHFWVIRTNGYGVPTTRWDFTAEPGGGTKAELRATININSGDERVKACL